MSGARKIRTSDGVTKHLGSGRGARPELLGPESLPHAHEPQIDPLARSCDLKHIPRSSRTVSCDSCVICANPRDCDSRAYLRIGRGNFLSPLTGLRKEQRRGWVSIFSTPLPSLNTPPIRQSVLDTLCYPTKHAWSLLHEALIPASRL